MNTVKHWTRVETHQNSGCTIYREDETGRFLVPCAGLATGSFETLPAARAYCDGLYSSY